MKKKKKKKNQTRDELWLMHKMYNTQTVEDIICIRGHYFSGILPWSSMLKNCHLM